MNCQALLLLPASMLVAPLVQAAETGDIKGHIVDEMDLAVPGAKVILSGVNIAGELTTTTDADGNFRLVAVPPGTHDLVVRKDNFAPMAYTVVVRLDETAFVPVTLSVKSTAGEVIVVEEMLPVIDTSRSAVSTQLTAEMLQNLPVGRSYQDVVNTVPGVYGRIDTESGGPGGGNPSVRGEGQTGNNYLIDGISTRDPATKTFGTSVNFDAIQEIQVYTDGLPAEFSQATGMLVNVVTKDGGDEHFGSASYYTNFDLSGREDMILDIEQQQEVPTEARSFWNHELSLTAGGPIIREKLWYFAAADLTRSHIDFEGADPNAPNVTNGGSGFAKLTWFASPALTLQYQFSLSLTDIQNFDTSGLVEPMAQADYRSNDITNIISARIRPWVNSEFELKLSTLNSSINVVPVSGDEDTPAIYDADTGGYYQNWTEYDYNDRSRMGGSLKYTQLVQNFLGDHRFKTGV